MKSCKVVFCQALATVAAAQMQLLQQHPSNDLANAINDDTEMANFLLSNDEAPRVVRPDFLSSSIADEAAQVQAAASYSAASDSDGPMVVQTQKPLTERLYPAPVGVAGPIEARAEPGQSVAVVVKRLPPPCGVETVTKPAMMSHSFYPSITENPFSSSLETQSATPTTTTIENGSNRIAETLDGWISVCSRFMAAVTLLAAIYI